MMTFASWSRISVITRSRPAPGQTPVAMWARNRHLAALVERSTHGTRKLATERLLDFTIPLPPREEQESIAAHLHELEGELREHLDEFSRLANDARTAFARLLPAVLARHLRHPA
jgi:hypothetical protein